MKLFSGYTDVRFGESQVSSLRRIRANILLGSFSGDSRDIYRAVHFLKDNAFFFADYSKEFFHRTDSLLKQGKIIEIRRLLVYSVRDEIFTEQSQRIIQFHSQNAGYAYRLINVNDYSALRQEYQIHPNMDFGIFGGKRVYRARTDRPDFIIGTWSSNKNEVEKYIKFFEICWNSSLAHKEASQENKPSINLDNLFLS